MVEPNTMMCAFHQGADFNASDVSWYPVAVWIIRKRTQVHIFRFNLTSQEILAIPSSTILLYKKQVTEKIQPRFYVRRHTFWMQCW